jgi:hypothetical protein
MKKKWVVLRVSSVLNFYWRESIHLYLRVFKGRRLRFDALVFLSLKNFP